MAGHAQTQFPGGSVPHQTPPSPPACIELATVQNVDPAHKKHLNKGAGVPSEAQQFPTRQVGVIERGPANLHLLHSNIQVGVLALRIPPDGLLERLPSNLPVPQPAVGCSSIVQHLRGMTISAECKLGGHTGLLLRWRNGARSSQCTTNQEPHTPHSSGWNRKGYAGQNRKRLIVQGPEQAAHTRQASAAVLHLLQKSPFLVWLLHPVAAQACASLLLVPPKRTAPPSGPAACNRCTSFF